MDHLNSADTVFLYSKTVEAYAHFFDRPEVRLRFLNNILSQQSTLKERMERFLGRHQFAQNSKLYKRFSTYLMEAWLYGLIFKELKQLLPSDARQRRQMMRRSKAPFIAHLLFGCYQFRHALYCVAAVLAVASIFGFYSLTVWSSHRVNVYLTGRYQKNVRVNGNALNNANAGANTKYLPDYRAEKVWLVERKDNYERYSNGGRVLTDYETTNHARGYYVFQHEKLLAVGGARHEPIGIVYHTSESHLMSFTSDNNESIETHTRGLLEYVQKNKSYNYVIDRFGQIHHIVRDEDAANHAGNSVWADAQGVYVGLNESFLGVCFETKSDTNDEQLTEAQLIAGRLLTQILRSRYNINDANCVTHGLVSVNPDNMMICFHHDWARNFPFEALGLSDKYKVAPVSITEFGFTYNDEIVNTLGGAIWEGATAAEDDFERRAEQAQMKPEDARRLIRNRYFERMELSRRARTTPATGAG